MKMTLGVTGAVLLALGVLAGPAQAVLVEGPRGPSAAGSVYELPLTPFGGAAYHALLSSEKYGFSSPSAFLHLGAGTWTDIDGPRDGRPRRFQEHEYSPPEAGPVRHERGAWRGVQPRRLPRGRAERASTRPTAGLPGRDLSSRGAGGPPHPGLTPCPSGRGHAGRGPGPRTRPPSCSLGPASWAWVASYGGGTVAR